MTTATFTQLHSLPELYFDPYFEQEAVKILPGSFYVTGRDMILVSVLGTSVCACIRDAYAGVGGLCHFMLPEPKSDRGWEAIAYQYGKQAIDALMTQLFKSGARKNRLEAKIFGACDALTSPSGHPMGLYNSRFVERFLDQEAIPIVSKDLMDAYPRKIYFFPCTGKVLVKKLKKLNNTTLLDREAQHYQHLSEINISDVMER